MKRESKQQKIFRLCTCNRLKSETENSRKVIEAAGPDKFDVIIGSVLLLIGLILSTIFIPVVTLMIIGVSSIVVFVVSIIRLARHHTPWCAVRGAGVFFLGLLGKLVGGFSF